MADHDSPHASHVTQLRAFHEQATRLVREVEEHVLPIAERADNLSPAEELTARIQRRAPQVQIAAARNLELATSRLHDLRDEIRVFLDQEFDGPLRKEIGSLLFPPPSPVQIAIVGSSAADANELRGRLRELQTRLKQAERRLSSEKWVEGVSRRTDLDPVRPSSEESLPDWQRRLITAYTGLWGAKVWWFAFFTLVPVVVGLKLEFIGLTLAPAHLVYVAYHALGVYLWFNVRHLVNSTIPWDEEERSDTWKRCRRLSPIVKVFSTITIVLLVTTLLGKLRVEFGGEKSGITLPDAVYDFLGVEPNE